MALIQQRVNDSDGSGTDIGYDNPMFVQPAAYDLVPYTNLDVDESEDDVFLAPCNLHGWFILNRATTTRYVKFYNDRASVVVVGTDIPSFVIPVPGNASDAVGATTMTALAIPFNKALTIAATTGFAVSDTGAPSANDVIVTLFYRPR